MLLKFAKADKLTSYREVKKHKATGVDHIPSELIQVKLYGCETWSLTLREECRLRVFEKRILRRIFVPKQDGNEEC